MSEQSEIQTTISLIRKLSAEAVADSADFVIAEFASDLIQKAYVRFAHEGVTLTRFKITFEPHKPTFSEISRRDPSALVGQFDLLLTAHGVVADQQLAPGGS